MPKEPTDKKTETSTPQRRPAPSQRAVQTYMHRNQPVQVPKDHFAVGRIVGVHGLKGEVKIELHTDFPERFVAGAELLIGEALRKATVIQSRPHKNQCLILLEGIQNRDEAETLRGEWLFVHEDDVIELEEDTYWVHDIVGLQVQTEEGQRLGVIGEVLFTGANEVYVVKTEGSFNQGKDLLLPAIAEVVQTVDLVNKVMTVRLLPGLLEV